MGDVSVCDGDTEHYSMDQNLFNYNTEYSNERAQNVDGAVTNSEINSNVKEMITEVIEDVNVFMSDDGNAGDKEVEIQIFGEEEDSPSEISEQDEAFAATQGDESYSIQS